MAHHNDLGKWGEKIAQELLITQGYAIMETNWRMGHYEIDLIAMKGTMIVFVEVKTRSTDIVDPLIAIERKRINHMVASANAYIRAYNIPHDARFDVITVIGAPDSTASPEVEHIEDAFLPPLRTYR